MEASGNSHLARSIFEINERFPRNVSALVLADDPRHRDENFQEHERIVDALEAGDAAKARDEMMASLPRGSLIRTGARCAGDPRPAPRPPVPTAGLRRLLDHNPLLASRAARPG
jgi:DNA-binding GntR family transcriptional regulator